MHSGIAGANCPASQTVSSAMTSPLNAVPSRMLHACCLVKHHDSHANSSRFRPKSQFAHLPVLHTISILNILPSKLELSYLGEADVVGLLAEALTADVQAVLADETSLVGADTASGMSVTMSIHVLSIHVLDVRRSRHTKLLLPCRRCVGASTRRIRAT